MAKPHPSGPAAVALIASAVALGLTATALAVDVRGSLDIQGDLTNPGNHAAEPPLRPYWEEWNGFLDTRDLEPEPNRIVSVVLLGEGGGGQPAGCTYALEGGDLDPVTMVAAKGSTLRIENTDGCSHELYAEGIDGFSPLQTAPGNARTASLPEAGHFVVRDRLYPHVVGHLHVVEGLVACAKMNTRGQFEFKDVPEGTYTLKVFRGADEAASQELEASGRSVTVDPIDLPAGK